MEPGQAPETVAATPAFDTRIWRIVGDPLVPGAPDGPLHGESVAVKDLYALAGQRVGLGNPAWLAAARVESETAPVVGRLLAAGADVRGIARTEEFAWSLTGANAHYGTPPNPRAPHRISGGSSSGSATATSLGHASIGLGTDTGGSVRVPAAYQGLYGIRTTHSTLDRTGLAPLAPSFDTVGWFTRTPELFERVGDVLLPPGSGRAAAELHVVPALLALAQDTIAAQVTALPAPAATLSWEPDLDGWVEAFRTVQSAEAWRAHGAWLAGRLHTLGRDVRGRFEYAAAVTAEQEAAARVVAERARDEIRDVVGDRVLVLPSAPTPAPLLGGDIDATRPAVLRLTCVAGLGGLPAVNVPLVTPDGLPCGACLIAAPGRDRDLLATAVALAGAGR